MREAANRAASFYSTETGVPRSPVPPPTGTVGNRGSIYRSVFRNLSAVPRTELIWLKWDNWVPGPRLHRAPLRPVTGMNISAPPDRLRPATKRPVESLTPVRTGPGEGLNTASWGAAMYKESKTYLTAAVTVLVVAILFSLTAILVRSVVAMDGKIAADVELRKSLP